MTTKKMTIKEIVDTIPARLGLDASQLDLSTPKKAYNFIVDSEFQIFAQCSGKDSALDNSPCGHVALETGYKAMKEVNTIFNDASEKKTLLEQK